MGVVGAMVGSTGIAFAAGLDSYPSDPSEAEASVVDSSLLGTDLAGAAHSEAGFPTNPGPNQEGLSLDLLGSEVIDLGGISLPVDQFIDFGQLGALYSESTATDELNAEAISGLLSGDGSITLDGDDAGFGAAEIDLLTLFDELGVNTLTDLIVDEALLRLGAGGAHVIAEDGEFLDQDGVGGAGQYRVAEASAFVHSPLVEEAAAQIYDAIGTIDDEMENQVNTLFDLTSITGALPAGVDLSETWIESDMQDEIFAALLAEPITTNNQFLTVDFSTGTVIFHLDQLLSGELRPDQPTGLNAQNPNTELIDDEIYPMIAESVHDVMEEATNIVVGAIEGALASVTVHFVATLSSPAGGSRATWDVNLMGDNLTGVTCVPSGLGGAALCTTLTTAINLLGPVVNTALVPVRDFLVSDGGQQIFDLLVRDIKTGAITVPIRQALEPFIELLAQVVSVQLNRQVTEVCTTDDGTEMPGSLEVSALSVGLVQSADAARLNFGNAGARIDACELAAVAELAASSPVPAGGETEITSGGWNPDTEVTLQLTDPDGNPVGDPVIVTTDADGNVPEGTTIPIPEDAVPGDYTVVGSDPDGTTAEAPLEVYAPTLEAGSPVAPGDCSDITSGGWLPESEVTLQLTDSDGNPVGDPVVVTTDADGNVPADTCVPIPDGTEPGDYDIVGTDDNGAEVTAPIEVTDDGAGVIDPTLDASSPVPAGGESVITSGGWNPDSEVTITLTDPDGNAVGDPVTVTTDADGNVPDGTTIPVPEDATPGEDYTVTGDDTDANTASDTIEVYAPSLSATSPVPAGGQTGVTSSGWLPESEVTLQLTDSDGNPAGDPVVVTTDADGNVPAGTALAVPGDMPAGTTLTVVGSDANGAEATADVDVVTAGAPVLDASSPVPAGGETTVTSSGWPGDTEVALQLTDADENPVGDPVTVTTDADGNVPAGTTVPVPENAVAGAHTLTGTDAHGNAASDDLLVYSPTLEVESPVEPGQCADITSGGWIPHSEVTLQLVDADGNPTGVSTTVTADENGDLPGDLCAPIPADLEPGDYGIVAADENGATVTAPLTVSAPAGSGTGGGTGGGKVSTGGGQTGTGSGTGGGQLPVTGGDLWLAGIPIALFTLLIGATLMGAARREERTASE
jgi:hypothetical protein